MDGKEEEEEWLNTAASRRPSPPPRQQKRKKRQRRGRPRRPEGRKPPLGTGDARWEDMYDRLVRYRAEHGHCDVPSGAAGGGDLGSWVGTQRSEYRTLITMRMAEMGTGRRPEGRYSKIVPERMERLRALGFRFRPRGEGEDDGYPGVSGGKGTGRGTDKPPPPPPPSTATTPAVRRTPAVRAEAVAAAFSSTSSPGGVGLAFRRAAEMRASVAAEKPAAKRPRVAAPDEPAKAKRRHGPPTGRGGQEERWNAMFRRLAEFQAEHGHCDVPTSRSRWGDDEGDLATLGRWVSRQRTVYRRASPVLTPERIRLLEGEGFTWRIPRRATGQRSGTKPTAEDDCGAVGAGGKPSDASKVAVDNVEEDDDGEVVASG